MHGSDFEKECDNLSLVPLTGFQIANFIGCAWHSWDVLEPY